MELYPHQTEWLNQILASFRAGNQSVMGQAPTGFGKTVCFSALTERLMNQHHQSSIILTHRQEIFLQTVESVSQMVSRISPICAKNTMAMLWDSNGKKCMIDMRSPIRIASIQTLDRKMKDGIPPPPADWVIVDEAHHVAAKSWADLIDYYKAQGSRILGVTATPERQDGQSLSSHFSDLVMGPSLQSLVEQGYLSIPEVFFPARQIKTDGLEGRLDQSARKLEKFGREIYGDAVQEYHNHCSGEPAVVFCVSVKAAEEVAERFLDAGYQAHSVDGQMREDERKRRLEGLANGSVHVITSCDLISEGMDVPAISACFLMRPTESRGLFMQQIGRSLRTMPGKKSSKIFDHAGNCIRHGHPFDVGDWNFHGDEGAEKPEKSIPNPKVCISCMGISPAGSKICRACGAELEIFSRQVEEVNDGMAVTLDDRVEFLQDKIGNALETVWASINAGESPEQAVSSAAITYEMGERWIRETQKSVETTLNWQKTPLGEK